MSKSRIAVLGALAAPLIVFGLIALAWKIDTAGADSHSIRGLRLAGADVSRRSQDDVRRTVEEQAAKFAATKVVLDAQAFQLDTTAAELGLTVDVDRTVTAVLATGRAHGPLAPLSWFGTIFKDHDVKLRLNVDQAKALAALTTLEGERRTLPKEPTVTADDSGIKLLPGTPGIAIHPDAVLGALPTEAASVTEPIKIDAPRTETKPQYSDDQVAALAKKATDATAGNITLTWTGGSTTVKGAAFRSGFRVVTDAAGPRLALDPQAVATVLSKNQASPFNPTGIKVAIVNGAPSFTPGQDVSVCCADSTPAKLAAALVAGQTTVAVEPRTFSAADAAAKADSLGIRQVIGEFTTKHAAGQPRVKNIHRIADLVRGQIIAPGATFSVNDFVGKRTVEKGFVSAPVIDKGEFSEDIGGGVSQFATTTFNAAFFAGLDIPEHKAHSIYISRYPFGREATLAYPSIDLKITNNTPNAVLIWPTYTDTTITVQLWGTPFAKGDQLSVTPPSGCGKVKLVRQRTYLADGKTDQQTYTANYNCNPPAH
jgi:vancomycin resistance protein YoaR